MGPKGVRAREAEEPTIRGVERLRIREAKERRIEGSKSRDAEVLQLPNCRKEQEELTWRMLHHLEHPGLFDLRPRGWAGLRRGYTSGSRHAPTACAAPLGPALRMRCPREAEVVGGCGDGVRALVLAVVPSRWFALARRVRGSGGGGGG